MTFKALHESEFPWIKSLPHDERVRGGGALLDFFAGVVQSVI